jgi:predicted permease
MALLDSVRYAMRGLRRSPGFSAAVILTLGLGIGANAAMFNVVDQLMFRPYAHLRDPGSVHRVYLRMPGRLRLLTRESFPYARYLDLRNWTTSFSQSAAFYPTEAAIGSGDAVRKRPIAAVSASFFDFFDAQPELGRYFVAAEDTTPSGALVAVLSHAFWKSDLGGRNVLGETIQIDNLRCTIIGVAPEGFVGVADSSPPIAFIPITTYGGVQPGNSSVAYWSRYTWDWAEMIVRRKPRVSVAQASADLTQAYIRSRDAARAVHSFMPRTDPVRPLAIAGAVKTPAGPYPGLEARTLLWVTGVAAIVLLIACANVANLFLARALRRRRETALRLALGVSRRELAKQSIVDSLLLSGIGCLVGISLAQWGGIALRRLFLPADGSIDVATDWRTLGIAVATAIVAGILTGLAPVFFAGRVELARALKAGAREGTYQRSRLRSSLLVVQVVLSMVLLVGAGLFVRSLTNLHEMPLGYEVDRVLMVRWERRGERMPDSARVVFRRRLLEAARAMPGVERAAWASSVPLQGTSVMSLFVPGIDSVGRLGRFTYQTASEDYFAVTGARILRGRGITPADRFGTPRVVVVSEGMAHTLWPTQDALGQCVRVGADTMPCSRVVGVVEDAVHDPVEDQPLRYYLPLEQYPAEGASNLFVSTRASDPTTMSERVRRTLQAAMPGQQYVTVERLANMLDASRRSWRVGATMFVAFGVLALIVAAVGLYGVITYTVGQRMHELGVRIALGAQSADVARLVVSQGLGLAVTGVTLGGAVSLLAARWIQPLLFRQSASDPLVFAVVGVTLALVTIAASAAPALRATKADPNTVLRAD